jgi:hypothetical protein
MLKMIPSITKRERNRIGAITGIKDAKRGGMQKSENEFNEVSWRLSQRKEVKRFVTDFKVWRSHGARWSNSSAFSILMVV